MNVSPISLFPISTKTLVSSGDAATSIDVISTALVGIPAASGALYFVPTGLTVNLEFTMDVPTSDTAVWQTYASGVVGSNSTQRSIGKGFRGLRFTRTSGTGSVLVFVGTGSVSGGSDSSSPLFTQDVGAPNYEDGVNGVAKIVPLLLNNVNTYNGTPYQNNSFTTAVVKNSGGNVGFISVVNTVAATRFLQLHNSPIAVSPGAVATLKVQVPGNAQVILGFFDLPGGGLNLPNGITIANSQTAATYTAGSAGDLLVDIYRN